MALQFTWMTLLIGGRNFQKCYDLMLKDVLQRLREAGLTIKASKVSWDIKYRRKESSLTLTNEMLFVDSMATSSKYQRSTGVCRTM